MVVIQYVVLEEPSVKLSRLLIFDCAGIERISVPRPNLVLLWYLTQGEPICIGCSNLRACSQSQRSNMSSSLKAKPARG